MAEILVAYFSSGGNTKKMAEYVVEGVKKEGMEATLKDIKDVSASELIKYEALIIGSPTYYGTMAYQVKKLLDDSVRFHGRLEGKAGAAFSSSANIAGGCETTILDILKAMLIHGMIIQGDSRGAHYGAAAVGAPDERARKECLRLGARVAGLVKKLG